MPIVYGNVAGIVHREAQPEVKDSKVCPKCRCRRPLSMFDSTSRWCSVCKEARANLAARRRAAVSREGDARPVTPQAAAHRPKDGFRNGKRVVCLETGKVFESSAAAARAVGLKSSGSIRQCLEGSKMTAAGYHWAREGSDLTVGRIEAARSPLGSRYRNALCSDGREG